MDNVSPSLQHALDRLPIEQVRVVDKPPDDAIVTLVQLEMQVEFSGPDIDVHLSKLPIERKRRQGRFEGEQYLEKRMFAGVPLDTKRLYKMFKGYAIVIQGA